MSKMHGNYEDVRFDFEGALELAREMWQLADVVDEIQTKREMGRAEALVDFSGMYAMQFVDRSNRESRNANMVQEGLRDDSLTCAQRWKQAMDEQNRRAYGRHIDDLKIKRSNFEKVSDFLTGFDFPLHPLDVPLPSPPSFLPTAELVRYS